MEPRPPYVSPFGDGIDGGPAFCSAYPRKRKLLLRLEEVPRLALELAEAPGTIALWVAGGKTRQARERRAELALCVRDLRRLEGWPRSWQLTGALHHDEALNTQRRSRGLPRLSVEETCASFELPRAAPPSRRVTKTEKRRRTRAEQIDALRKMLDALIVDL